MESIRDKSSEVEANMQEEFEALRNQAQALSEMLSSHEALHFFSEQLHEKRKIEDICAYFLDYIEGVFIRQGEDIDGAAFLVNEATLEYRSVALKSHSLNKEQMEDELRLQLEVGSAAWCIANQRSTYHEPLSNKAAKLCFLLPLSTTAKTHGIVVLYLGCEVTALTHETMQLIKLASSQTSLYIENVLAFEEINNYRENLEKIVAERTSELETANIQITNYAKDMEKQVEERTKQLVFAEKMSGIGVLAAGVAHELNQPLTGMKLMVQSVGRKAEKGILQDGMVIETMREVDRLIERMRKITNHMRSFVRHSDIEFREADINEVVRHGSLLLQSQLKIENIELVENLADDIPRISIDENMIEQVVINLIANAKDALIGRKDAKIELSTASCDLDEGVKGVQIEVRDNGPGIDEQTLAKIFEPFFTTKEQGKGTGLGLYICFNIVRDHQGTIVAESKVGCGTAFKIILPTEGKG